MSRLKFEKQFKEKLEKQEIRPSAGSWEKLESRLKEEKKPKWIWWTGMAASVVAGILIFSLIFNNNPIPKETEIVNQSSKIDNLDKKTEKKQEFVSNQGESIPTSKTAKGNSISKKGVNTTSSVLGILANSDDKNTQIKKRKQLKPIPKKEETHFLSAETAKSIVGTSSEENNIQNASDAEINALLKEAQLDLQVDSFESPQNYISAQALLKGVETELNRSFRDKIFNTLEEKFLEFALVSRN